MQSRRNAALLAAQNRFSELLLGVQPTQRRGRRGDAAGELYHQYHDDMVEKYGPDYAAMRQPAVARGTLAVSKCPGDKGLGL
jgi:hypothetical protein